MDLIDSFSNFKKLNEFIIADLFKMENLQTALNLVFPGYFLRKIDMQDAYYTVAVHPEINKFLRFEYFGKIYQFTCLLNGLSCAPFIFRKIMKILRYSRSKGFLSVAYLDDILCIGKDYESCYKNSIETKELLIKLGFSINNRKTELEPSVECKFFSIGECRQIRTIAIFKIRVPAPSACVRGETSFSDNKLYV